MSGKQRRAKWRQAPASVTTRHPRRGSWLSPGSVAILIGVIAIVAASFILPRMLADSTLSAGAARAKELGVPLGTGVPDGSAVPAFFERDLLTDQPITADSVYNERTLLFFSEGIMCQACFEQIRDLQSVGVELQRRGIQLISITPDPPSALRQSVARFEITTPVISDADRTMSQAFNTLGRGMHADTPGHAFVLLDRGKVLWYRDYYLPPSNRMYVPVTELLAALPRTQ